ncbi:restriction endonuclease subunit S [Patescibacteria group bacterium]|nr:restriction endonuclease subunit S [Patescibacteria group bacterium]
MTKRIQKNNWQTKKLGDILKLEYGKPLPKTERSSDGKYPVYGANGIKDFSNKFYFDKPSIVVGRKGSAGKLHLVEKNFWPLDVTYFVTFDDKKYDLNFLFHLLSDLELSKLAKGVKPGINRNDVYSREVNIPPLPEQRRIVKILDEIFEKTAKAKENSEKNLQNAKELFESYLQSVFENPGEDWKKKRFDKICVLQRGFDLPTRLRNIGKFPLVSSNGITDQIDLWKVKAPGVVTGRSGTIGNVHYIEKDFWPLNTALYIKEFYGNNERFIYYLLKQFDLSKYSSGAGVPTLNRNNVHDEMVLYPRSLNEQKYIVKKLDGLSAKTKKLETIYQKKLSDLEELKKSVLKRAFSGKL